MLSQYRTTTTAVVFLWCSLHLSNHEKPCNELVDVGKLKKDYYCDTYILKSLDREYKALQDTNKYLKLQLSSYQKSLSEDCTFKTQSNTSSNYCEHSLVYKSCSEAVQYGEGVYKIESPDPNHKPFMVFCTIDQRKRPWTVIQRRAGIGGVFFDIGRNWNSYRNGFGDLLTDHWLGLDKINALTYRKPSRLWIQFVESDGKSSYAMYEMFAMGNRDQMYSLLVLGEFSGTTTDSLREHAGLRFSTVDNLNEEISKFKESKGGGWWFKNSDGDSNLNGVFKSKFEDKGPRIFFWGNDFSRKKFVQMALGERT